MIQCKYCGKVATFKLKIKEWICPECEENDIEEDEIFEYLESKND